MKTRNKYQTPEVEVINIESENTIMNASVNYDNSGERTTDGVARGRERNFWGE